MPHGPPHSLISRPGDGTVAREMGRSPGKWDGRPGNGTATREMGRSPGKRDGHPGIAIAPVRTSVWEASGWPPDCPPPSLGRAPCYWAGTVTREAPLSAFGGSSFVIWLGRSGVVWHTTFKKKINDLTFFFKVAYHTTRSRHLGFLGTDWGLNLCKFFQWISRADSGPLGQSAPTIHFNLHSFNTRTQCASFSTLANLVILFKKTCALVFHFSFSQPNNQIATRLHLVPAKVRIAAWKLPGHLASNL